MTEIATLIPQKMMELFDTGAEAFMSFLNNIGGALVAQIDPVMKQMTAAANFGVCPPDPTHAHAPREEGLPWGRGAFQTLWLQRSGAS